MRVRGRTGFTLGVSEVRNNILVPHYYDPFIPQRLSELEQTHELVELSSLLDSGELTMRQGRYIPKIHYGTGPHPYIRTSDIANFELRGVPKHGVSKAVYDEYAPLVDVRPDDVLLVHEGSYLIGSCALVTKYDTGILIQHHLAKLRCSEGARITPNLLMALLLSPIVQRQIRSKQLTADIIDSIVGRVGEVILPLPWDTLVLETISKESRRIFAERAKARSDLARLFASLDDTLISADPLVLCGEVNDSEEREGTSILGFLGDRGYTRSFNLLSSSVRNDVLVPRYYDPSIRKSLSSFEAECDLATIGELRLTGALTLGTGDEVGKLAYGTGPIPFVRTSDLGNWEVKSDPKHSVAVEIAARYADKQSAEMGDILLVRDGTYLVGTTAMVAELDTPMLYCGGVIRIRCLTSRLNPSLLLALLNTQIVRRQMRALQFTRDIIDTLGKRVDEVVLPIPRSSLVRQAIADEVSSLLRVRANLRSKSVFLGEAVESGDTSSLFDYVSTSFDGDSG